MSKHIVVFCLVLLSLALVFTSGCKKKDKDPVIIIQPDVGGDHYYVADVYGDLFNAQINAASGLYSFLQLAGPNLLGVGQGTITPASGLGTNAYYDEEGAMWALNSGKFVAMGGDNNLVFGVPTRSTAYPATVIAGMYNILSADFDPSDGTVTGDYGTLQIDAVGTWTLWWNLDGTVSPATMADDTGTWQDYGNGLVGVISSGMGAKIGDLAIYPSASGNILVMNYGAYHPLYGAFYGMLVGLSQASVGSGDLDGTYDSISYDETVFQQAVITGANVVVDGNPADTLTFDDPWTGMISGGVGIYIIGSQDGFVMRVEINFAPGNDSFLIAVEEQ